MTNELYHHGIKGQKWGVRRYQNPDGSLTDAGRKRYDRGVRRVAKLRARADKYDRKSLKAEKSAHRFLFRDAEAAYAKYSKYKYKAIKTRKKADKLEAKMANLARNTKLKSINTIEFGSPERKTKTGLLTKAKNYVAEKKREKKRNEALEKRKATIAQKKAHELEKSEALKSGDPVRISKFQNELTNDELRAATDRVRLTATLNSQKEDSIKTGLDKAESIMSKAVRVKNLAEQGIGVWNTAAKLHNSFSNEDEKWPIIDGSGKKEDRRAIKRVIESGDPEQIAKLKGKLSVSETTDAIKSINNWKNIEANASQNASNRAAADARKREAEKAVEKAQTDKFEKYYQWKAKSDASRDAAKENAYSERYTKENENARRSRTSSGLNGPSPDGYSSKSKSSNEPYFTFEDAERAQKLLNSYGRRMLLEDKKRK